VELKRGDLIRWITDHEIYEASGDVLTGIKPNYRHGIVIEVSALDNNAVMLYCYDCKKKREGTWMILNLIHDEFEILSEASNG
jgi:hypothetical protein